MKPVNSFFDFVNNIAFDRDRIDINVSDDKLYSAFITNRYLTFASKSFVPLINNSVNMYGHVFSAHDHYNFMFNLIPKTKRRFIRYVKKNKKENTEKNNAIELVAKNLELSKREVELYSEKFKVNIKKYG